MRHVSLRAVIANLLNRVGENPGPIRVTRQDLTAADGRVAGVYPPKLVQGERFASVRRAQQKVARDLVVLCPLINIPQEMLTIERW